MTTSSRRRTSVLGVRVRRALLVGVGVCVSLTSVLAGASTPARTAAVTPDRPSAGGGTVAAAALPSATGTATPDGTVATAAVRPASSPTIPAPPDANSDYGIQFDPITTRAERAKVRIRLPFLISRTYLTTCIVSPSFTSPCRGHDVGSLPKLPFDYTWDIAYADNWVATRVNGNLVYGQFPPVRVSLLAFGTIPVSATVHLTQVVRNGRYVPLKLKLPIDVSPVPPGRHIPGYGPAPSYNNDVTFFSYLGTVTGAVNIRLSDVTVDQVPLPVGPSCQTATPAQLRLTSPAGYYPANATAKSLEGKPGEFQPLSPGPGGYLQGNVAVPAFSGCRNGGDDLDRLMTNFVSGPLNAVNAYSPQALRSWCEEPIAHCSAASTAADRLARTVRSSAQVRAALADGEKRAILLDGAPAVSGPAAP